MKPIIIAGPCVIESQECLNEVEEELVRLNTNYDLDIIFKSSFDKANRTSIKSFRGPGIEKGLTMLNDIREKYGHIRRAMKDNQSKFFEMTVREIMSTNPKLIHEDAKLSDAEQMMREKIFIL